jgi:DNA-binding FadR family transcriptional regulator
MRESDRHRTLHNRVLAVLGPAIAAGDYRPGHVFTLDRLESGFGVSRTVAREAVRVLESMGLVVSRPRVGVRVQPDTAWNVFDPDLIRWRLSGRDRARQLRSLTALRAAVEPAAAAEAAEHASAAGRARLTELSGLLAATGEAGDLDAFLKHDVEFHRLVLVESGNEMFAGLCDVIAEVLTGRTVHNLMPPRPRPEALRLHALVATSIDARLPDVAAAAMRGIMAEVGDQVDRIARADRGGCAGCADRAPDDRHDG